MSTSFGWKGKGRYGLFRLPCHPFSENPGYVQRGLTIMVVCHVGTRSYYSLKPRSRYVLREHVDFYGSVHTHCVVVRRRTQHVAQSELVRRRTAKQLCQWQQQWIIRFSICRVLRRRTANSAFHPSGVGKWVPTSAGKVKAGMVHSVSGWRRGVQVKLWDPLWTRAIPERLWGVITTRRYTNPRLLTLPYVAVRRRTLTHADVRRRMSAYVNVRRRAQCERGFTRPFIYYNDSQFIFALQSTPIVTFRFKTDRRKCGLLCLLPSSVVNLPLFLYLPETLHTDSAEMRLVSRKLGSSYRTAQSRSYHTESNILVLYHKAIHFPTATT